MPLKSVNIIGSGSMGHLWAAYITKQGIPNSLYTNQQAHSKQSQLTSSQESFVFKANYKQWHDWCDSDLIIICVKCYSLEEVCIQLKQKINSSSPIILMMNGMGLVELVESYLTNRLVFQASTTHGVHIQKEKSITLVNHTGMGETLIGYTSDSTQESTTDNILKDIISDLNICLAPVVFSKHHYETLLVKLYVNSVINPITSIYQVKNGALLEDDVIRAHALKLTKQLHPLIKQLTPNETWETIWQKIAMIAENTKKNLSSMYQDLLNKKPTEIEFITGYLLRISDQHGLDLSEHRHIFNQVKALEN